MKRDYNPIIKMYRSGKTLQECGDCFGISKGAIYKMFKKLGISRRTRSENIDPKYSHARALYYAGKSGFQLAKFYGVGISTMYGILRVRNTIFRPSYAAKAKS